MNDWPNAYDWDTDEENRGAIDRATRHRADAERIKADPTLQDPLDQAAIDYAIKEFDGQIQERHESRPHRVEFMRRGLIPPD